MSLYLKQTLPPIIWIFTEGEGDEIESRLPFKIFFTLLIKISLKEFLPRKMWITEWICIWKNCVLNCACKCNHPKICWNLLLLSSLCKFYRCFENVIVSETSDIYAIYDLCRTLPSRRMFSRYLTAKKTNVVKVVELLILNFYRHYYQ